MGALLDLARGAVSTPNAPGDESEHYRWRITGANCGTFEACFLPEATRAEVERSFPGAVVAVLPELPDAAASVSAAPSKTASSKVCDNTEHF